MMCPGGMRRIAFALVAVFRCRTRIRGDANERPRVYTNQEYIEDVSRQTTLPLDDPKAMFAVVLDSLPDRVKVYPTESYYYFRFFTAACRYAGNIRLDSRLRDEGKGALRLLPRDGRVAEGRSSWPTCLFGNEDGVTVERLRRFVYRVSVGGRSVEFELNDFRR